MIQLDHFFWGVETIVPSTQRVIRPAFLLNPIPVQIASASHVGRAMKLGLFCLPGISPQKTHWYHLHLPEVSVWTSSNPPEPWAL